MLARLTRWWRGPSGGEAFADGEWAALAARLPLLEGWSAEDLDRLRVLAGDFLRRKVVQGAGGLEVDDAMRRLVAVQACVPVLHLGLDWYSGWVSVIVYPDEFVARQEWVDEDGVAHEVERELSGEAWPEGPAILSWTDVELGADGEDWGNVVVHGEFFAVMSEAFFLHPRDVREAYPEVYGQLEAFYRQDPGLRLGP